MVCFANVACCLNGAMMDLGLNNPQRHDTLFPTFPYWHRAAWQGTKRTTTLEILYIIPQSDKNNRPIESGNEKTMACVPDSI